MHRRTLKAFSLEMATLTYIDTIIERMGHSDLLFSIFDRMSKSSVVIRLSFKPISHSLSTPATITGWEIEESLIT